MGYRNTSCKGCEHKMTDVILCRIVNVKSRRRLR